MIRPAIARLRPSSSGFALIRDSARWPQTIPAIAETRKNPQQNPHTPRMLKINERTASCSVFRCGTTAPGGVATTAAGVTGGAAGVAGAGLVGTCAALTPGTVESAAHPAAPSYQAW